MQISAKVLLFTISHPLFRSLENSWCTSEIFYSSGRHVDHFSEKFFCADCHIRTLFSGEMLLVLH